MYPEEQYAVRALKAGASGYLTKESAPDELIEAIRKASSGGKYVTSSLAEKLAFYLEGNADRSPHDRLSDREFQVLCMIANGQTVKEIAEGLHLSIKTIGTHRGRILNKMQLKNNAALVRYAIEHRLVD